MPKGWMVMIDGKQLHKLHFVGYEHVTNISYSAMIHDLEKEDWMTIQHQFYQRIDYTDFTTKLDEMVDPTNSSHKNLDYYLSDDDDYIQDRMYKLTYILRGLEEPTYSTTTQGGVYKDQWEVNALGDGTYGREVGYRMKMYKCFWPNCIKPTTTTTTGKLCH